MPSDLCTAQLLFQLLCWTESLRQCPLHRCWRTTWTTQSKRRPTCSAQLHLPTHDLFWAKVRVQLHLPPLRSLDLLISPGTLWGGRWSWTLKIAQKRSWAGRWSWAAKVGLLSLRAVPQQRCNGHCPCDPAHRSALVAAQWRFHCSGGGPRSLRSFSGGIRRRAFTLSPSPPPTPPFLTSNLGYVNVKQHGQWAMGEAGGRDAGSSYAGAVMGENRVADQLPDCIPSKHARSDSHPVRLGSISQKRAGWFLHTGLLPDRIRLAKTRHSQPELNRIRAGFAQYYPGRLWKNGTESENGKLVAGRLRPARNRAGWFLHTG